MKSISDITENYQPSLFTEKQIDFPFQELGIEMQDYYGQNIWWLFHKEYAPLGKIREAFKIAQRKKNKSFPYLVGIIKKL